MNTNCLVRCQGPFWRSVQPLLAVAAATTMRRSRRRGASANGLARMTTLSRFLLAMCSCALPGAAFGQVVTLAELQGAETSTVRQQTWRRNGVLDSGQVQSDVVYRIGPGETLTSTVRITSRSGSGVYASPAGPTRRASAAPPACTPQQRNP
jgi:hypothetical protein